MDFIVLPDNSSVNIVQHVTFLVSEIGGSDNTVFISSGYGRKYVTTGVRSSMN
jgi:hypothetical protein